VGESEGGQKFLPPNPLPFCPPERSGPVLCAACGGALEISVRIFAEKGSDFVQGVEPNGMSRAKSSAFLFIYGLIQMFEYFILVYFLSHKLADSVKDDFKRFVK